MLHNDFRYPVPSYQHVTYNPVVYSALSVSSSYSLQRVKLLGERKKQEMILKRGKSFCQKSTVTFANVEPSSLKGGIPRLTLMSVE